MESQLRELDLIVALGSLTMSGEPGQDFVLLCLYSSGNAAVSGMVLKSIAVGEGICLPVTVGRRPEALLPCEGEWALLGVSAIASLEDRTLNRLKVGDFEEEGWVAKCGDVALLR